jgi:hypothetical protein
MEGLLVYKALIRMVESNSGTGFHNSDQGHPDYAGPAQGTSMRLANSDGPDTNDLFKLLRDLSKEYGGEHGPRIATWEEFCQLAYNAYLKDVGRKNKG